MVNSWTFMLKQKNIIHEQFMLNKKNSWTFMVNSWTFMLKQKTTFTNNSC